MRRRMLTMALAALLAVLGTVAVLAYVHQANNRAVAGLKTENVLVAKAAIPAGTKAALAVREGLLTRQQFPRESLPADPVQSITSATGGLVINVEMQPGQMLLRPMLVPATQVTASGGLVVPSGMFAVTVQLCVPEAVAGFVTAGSKVAVFDTAGGPGLNAQRTCDVTHQAQAFNAAKTQLVLASAKVLTVGSASTAAQGTSSGGASTVVDGSANSASSTAQLLVTFVLNQADAEKLIAVAEVGLPYLALLPPTP